MSGGLITPSKPAVGKSTRKSLIDTIIDAIAALNGVASAVTASASVSNGSFEVGSAADTAPDGWDLSIAAGNSTAFETAAGNTAHGAQAFSMTTPGGVSGGVVLTSTDFILCSNLSRFTLAWLTKSSTATTTTSVKVQWFTNAQVSISTDTLYSNTSTNPTSWTPMSASLTPPSTARFFKLIFTGVNDTNAATTYFDGIFLINSSSVATLITATGAGTYTRNPVAKRLLVRGIGGGGGGGEGGNAAGGAAGATGGDTWFNTSSFKGRGGLGGGGGVAGGGGAVGGAGRTNTNVYGYPYNVFASAAGSGAPTGVGGNGANTNSPAGISAGGGFGNGDPTPGGAGTANTGAGGGGGGGTTKSGGGGGGAGEYFELWVDLDSSSTYAYFVGDGGNGGSGTAGAGSAGGKGGSGYLHIMEFS